MDRKKGNEHGNGIADQTFAAGYITRYLEDYANRRALPPVEFALGVAELIFTTQGGQVLGLEHHVPDVRSEAAQGSQTVEPVAVVKHSHRQTPLKPKPSWFLGLKPKAKTKLATKSKSKPKAKAKTKMWFDGMSKAAISKEMSRRKRLGWKRKLEAGAEVKLSPAKAA